MLGPRAPGPTRTNVHSYAPPAHPAWSKRPPSAEEGAALWDDAGTVHRLSSETRRSPTPGSRGCSSSTVPVWGPPTGIHLPVPRCPAALIPESRSLGVGIWDCQDTRTGQQRTRREERECLHAGLRNTSSLWEKLKQHLREKGAWQSEGSGKARRPSDDTNGSPLETAGRAQGWGARRRLSEVGTRHAAGRGRARGLRAGPRPRPLPGACRWRLRKGS